jgi:beta-galactosidase/beta-glucuronidase
MSALLVQELPLRPTPNSDDIPRSEYPQPQFERDEWLSLNGSWEFAFDDDNRGIGERWATSDHVFDRTILVPFCFESPKSGIGDASFHPQVWYRRGFAVPRTWDDRRIILNFGAVDYRATVWINGRLAGQHEGGHTPFSFDISALIEKGPNVITVRVEDPPTDRYIPRGKQHWEAESESIFYKRTTGIWQSVWLEAVGDSYLERVRVDSNTNGSVTFSARVAAPRPGLQFAVAISYEGRVLATSTVEVDGNQATAGAFIRDPKLWSPSSPELYEVVYELRDFCGSGTPDRVRSYFGFRSISTQDGRVLLNGVPIFLKMVLDQGYWPESNLTPPSDEAIRYDIEMAKQMGFNGVRKHQKIEDPRFLYWADRFGLLVSAEMANAYMFDENSVARVTQEWIEALARDFNHPSIVIWVPINESWGVPNVCDSRQQAHLKAMYLLTKSLDSSRLVIDNDGWEHTDCTDLFAIHDYSRDGKSFYKRFAGVQEGKIPSPFQGKLFLAPGCHYNGAPIFLSEFGGISYKHPASENNVPKNSWGYEGIEHSEQAMLKRMRSLYQAVAELPQIVGICYTQLTDVEQEINGLLTYDRRPKFDSRDIRKINALLC